MSFRHVLIPGRHHVLTRFMAEYFGSVVRDHQAVDLHGHMVQFESPHLVWAVTSANHENTRRNPLPGHRREVGIERFSDSIGATSSVFLINDVGTTNRFADHVLKDIEVQSRGRLSLTPDNTVVATSTPSVIALYEALGYTILPIELVDQSSGKSHLRAWDVLVALVAAGDGWRTDDVVVDQLHPASAEILERYALDEIIIEVHNDPLVGDEGDITESRNYEEYRAAFDEGADRKYTVVAEHIRPGRIVDIGCANGGIIALMSRDDRLRESDLYGIEVTRSLYERCLQRRGNGDFANENVFFYQRNIMSGKLFPDQSVHTTTAFSLTHEIESYLGRDALFAFITQVYEQTAPGGVFINLDVTGPEDGDRQVFIRLAADDGLNEPDDVEMVQPASAQHLASLSTRSRFLRFAHDFRREEGDVFDWEWRNVDSEQLVATTLRNGAEFLSKKDYTDSWYSEMHETFCYWSASDWRHAAEAVGFRVAPQSGAYRNDWLIDNRYRHKAEFLMETTRGLEQLDYPVTNMLLVAERPG